MKLTETHLTRNRLVGITVAGLIATVAATVPVATAQASEGSLTGEGSTLVAPLLEKWKATFEKNDGIPVTYGATGSGAGISAITARSVDFGASDAPLTAAQTSECKGCYQIPWALTATGVGYHLEGVASLKLTGPVLASIYLGHITNWNNKAIAKLNPGVRLPNLPISVVYRSDGSGDTYAFTNYLSDISSEWKSKVGNATSVSFPVGTGADGNSGVAAVISSTNGAIGYAAASYLIAHSLSAAAIKNAAGNYEYPNVNNIESAAHTIKKVPANNELHIVDPPKSAKIAYPISTFTYVIVPKVTPAKALLTKFIDYAIGEGQAYGPALDFAPIPSVVIKAEKSTVAKFVEG